MKRNDDLLLMIMMPFDIYAYKEFELYGSEMPETEIDLDLIKNLEIKIIISLDESIQEHPNYEDIKKDFEHHELFIVDFDIPTNDQIIEITDIIAKAREEKKAVLVHCLAGCGRTGLILALAEKLIYGTKDGEKAIQKVRKIRPCAVETKNQYDLIMNYER
jgi:protein-tyrosine phosphatase